MHHNCSLQKVQNLRLHERVSCRARSDIGPSSSTAAKLGDAPLPQAKRSQHDSAARNFTAAGSYSDAAPPHKTEPAPVGPPEASQTAASEFASQQAQQRHMGPNESGRIAASQLPAAQASAAQASADNQVAAVQLPNHGETTAAAAQDDAVEEAMREGRTGSKATRASARQTALHQDVPVAGLSPAFTAVN